MNMINKKNFVYKDQVEKLCNILINAQELLNDLEDLEEDNLFQLTLKFHTKKFLELLEKSINDIYNVGTAEILTAIRKKESKEKIEELKEKHKDTNSDIINIYEKLAQARNEYNDIPFNHKLLLTTILEELKREENDIA